MSKSKIDEMIPAAYKILSDSKSGISKSGKISKSFRGQIAAFGAAVTTGSLLSAIAFFSQKGNAEVDRDKLIIAIFELVKEYDVSAEKYDNLFEYVKEQGDEQNKKKHIRNLVLDAAISLKLAMNLFQLVDNKGV